MYPHQVGRKLGIVGATLQYEVDLMSFLAFTEQEAEINEKVEAGGLQSNKELSRKLDALLNQAKRG